MESFILTEIFNSVNFNQILANIIVQSGLKNSIKLIKSRFEELRLKNTQYGTVLKDLNLSISEDIIIRNIISNLDLTNNWCKEVLYDMSTAKLVNIYVDLDLLLTLKRKRLDSSHSLDKIPFSKISSNLNRNLFIQGDPGAGKTTLMKKLCQEMFNNSLNHNFSYPILVKFNGLNYPDIGDLEVYGLYEILFDLFGFSVSTESVPDIFIGKEHFQIGLRNLKINLLLDFLNENRFLIIFEAFDEIPNKEISSQFADDLMNFTLRLNHAKFILTTRTGELENIIENSQTYEISPLIKPQIEQFISNYISNTKEADKVFKLIDSYGYSFAINPLLLTYLINIYKRSGDIPPRRTEIYEIIVSLLLEDWDLLRGVKRISKYRYFATNQKKRFLSHLAYYLSMNLKGEKIKGDVIQKFYHNNAKFYKLPNAHHKFVIDELESQTSILKKIAFNEYAFSHESIREYLTANYLLSYAGLPSDNEISNLPNEIAIAICLSPRPDHFYGYFIMKIKSFQDSYWRRLIRRIALEIPTFNDNPISLVFFYYLLQRLTDNFAAQETVDKYHERIEPITLKRTLIYSEKDYSDSYFIVKDEVIKILIEANLKETYKAFLKSYKKRFTLDKEIVTFELNKKDLNKGLSERFNMPRSLMIEDEILKITDEWNL